MRYLGEDRVYIDPVSGVGVDLRHNMVYPAAIVSDENRACVTIGANAEVVIDYTFEQLREEWDV